MEFGSAGRRRRRHVEIDGQAQRVVVGGDALRCRQGSAGRRWRRLAEIRQGFCESDVEMLACLTAVFLDVYRPCGIGQVSCLAALMLRGGWMYDSAKEYERER